MGCNINTTFTTNTIRVTMQAGGGSGGSGTDELVKVSSNDIAAEYLEEKIIAGNNITITKNTDSNGIEILEVSQDEVDYIKYITSPSLPTIVQGMRYWDSVNGTTSLYLGNDVTLQDGQELHIYGKAGENISNRDVIQFDAARGDFIILKKAVPNEIRLNPYLLRGVATQSINDDNFGHVTWFGKVNNVYTTGWDVDDLLYYNYSGNGLMTNIAPTNGDPVILIGQVLKLATGAAENGVIIVFPPIVLITKLSDLQDDSTHRTVTDTEKSTWNGKKAGTYKGWYDAEIVASPTTGTLTLKNSTETVLETALTNSNAFTVAMPTPTAGQVNESVLIFSIGATLPTITQPNGIVWRGTAPTLAINKNYTICYEQVNTTGTTFAIRATGVQSS